MKMPDVISLARHAPIFKFPQGTDRYRIRKVILAKGEAFSFLLVGQTGKSYQLYKQKTGVDARRTTEHAAKIKT